LGQQAFYGVDKMNQLFVFLRDESGSTAIEYGLIATLVSVSAITAYFNAGRKLKSTFNDVASNLAS
jgi:pilus assembly protein Flp/PilA